MDSKIDRYRKFQSFKRLPEYITLSGAGRKRFWNLVKQQVPPEEAIFVASRGKNDEKILQLKRTIPNQQSGTPKKILKTTLKETKFHPNKAPNPMPDKTVNAQTENSSKLSESESENQDIKSKVSLVEIHNTQLMSDEKINMIHDALLLEIAKGEAGKGPRFCGFFNKKGFILVLCENYYSQDWLVKTIEIIKPWPEAELFTKLKNRTLIASTFLPGHEADTVEKALKLLQIQNKGLNTGDWRVLSEREFEGGRVVTFSIDRYSFEALKISKFKALLGFRNIYLKIMANPHPQEVSQPNNVIESTLNEKAPVGSEMNSEALKEEVTLNKDSSVNVQVEELAQDEIKTAEQEEQNQEEVNQEAAEFSEQDQPDQHLSEPCWAEEL